MIEKLYTVEEVAELASVTGRTIRNYLKSGRLVGRKIGGQWRFPEAEVQRLLTGAEPEPEIKPEERQESPLDNTTATDYSAAFEDTSLPEETTVEFESTMVEETVYFEKREEIIATPARNTYYYPSPAPLPGSQMPPPVLQENDYFTRPEADNAAGPVAVASATSGPPTAEAVPPTTPAQAFSPPAANDGYAAAPVQQAPTTAVYPGPQQPGMEHQLPPQAYYYQQVPVQGGQPVQPSGQGTALPSWPEGVPQPAPMPQMMPGTQVLGGPQPVQPPAAGQPANSAPTAASGPCPEQGPPPMAVIQTSYQPQGHTVQYQQHFFRQPEAPQGYPQQQGPQITYVVPQQGPSFEPTPAYAYTPPAQIPPVYPPSPSAGGYFSSQPTAEPSTDAPVDAAKASTEAVIPADEVDTTPEQQLSDVGKKVTQFIAEVHDYSKGPQMCTVVDLYQTLDNAKITSERMAEIAEEESVNGQVCQSYVEFDDRFFVARYTLFGSTSFLLRCLKLIG